MKTTLYKRLYKLNSDGKTVQLWETHIAKDFKTYWTVSGQLEGKKVTSSPTAIVPKVKRSQKEQALLEVDQKITLKMRKRYVEKIDAVQVAEESLPGYSAMLAKKWEDQKKKINFPGIAQPKLDGVRCLVTKDGMFTRGRKPIEACQHVWEALQPFFAEHPGSYLDGELYAHEMKNDFEKIVKAVRKIGKRVTAEDLALQAKVQYHIYDAPRISGWSESDTFVTRHDELYLITNLDSTALRLVETKDVATEEDLYEIHSDFLAQGYEGTMVRNTDMVYKGSRSSELLKMKEFEDGEFEILSVNEGKGALAGHAATFTMRMPHGAEFKAKLKGSFARLKAIWEEQSLVIGKMCTVVYQGITNKEQVPRFPIVKAIRGLKDRSDWL